ncbi:MAG: efflux RND transporter permease subunit [Desulfobacteraceae bacterium]|nr:efflux RND transporter permease subunit [Desulfobacteraceae bacterium]MBC2754504.1 efflux RND transporter permease subunit [Desulfobacteraceae bacterium]
MNIPEISINRYVFAFMLSAVIVLFGIVSYNRIGIDEFPDIDVPMITITTTLIGADPDIIDSTVTNIIETAVNSTPGIEHIQSKSAPGFSVVMINFQLSKDIDVAFNEVQTKINQVLRDLPKDADPPIIAKVEFGTTPILWLTLQGDRTLQQLNLYVKNILKKRLENINGVGEVRVGGERERNIRINLQPDRMAALAITIPDIISAFKREHIQMPGGFLVGGNREDLVKLDIEFHKLEDIKKLIIAYRNNAPLRLSRVAEVEDGLADYRQIARFNDQPCVSLGIVKVTGSNSVAIVEAVKDKLKKDIIPQLPPGLEIKIASNDADFIEESVQALKEHLLLGTLFAALVVFAFLKSLRSTLIISVAIPVSLLGAIMVMYFSGYTFNKMTMLGLLLLIGIVVDDAIVVLENIFKQRELGEVDPKTAALTGTNQVVFAVLAATFALVCIFAPVIYMKGIIGRFFQAFSVVVTVGVLVSLFVSITLTPMLCSRYLVVKTQHGKLYQIWEKMLQSLEWLYGKALFFSLNFRWIVVVITIAIVYIALPLFGQLGKEFMPNEDKGQFNITFKTPLGSSLDYTNDRLTEIEKILQQHEEIEGYLSSIGTDATGQVSSGTISVRLTPLEGRKLKQYDLLPILRKKMAKIPGIQAFPTPVSVIGGQRGEKLQFKLTGPELAKVAEYANILNKKLITDPDVGQVDLDLKLDLPQLKLIIDRTRAADLGISGLDIAYAVNALVGGLDIAKYNDEPGDGERYDIRLKAESGRIEQPQDFRRIYLRSKTGELVRLDTVVSVQKILGPAVISRFDLEYAADFYATPNASLGVAINKVMTLSKDILPIGYAIKMTGRAEEFSKTVHYISFTFIMAILLVYMVLASQFNSFIQPLVIMVAQPLAIIGGVFGLWFLNHSLNIFSMVGLVLLMGLVAKNSILLVDMTNQLRNKGKGIDQALQEACPNRLRPVLMTSLTVIFAMFPAALGYGAGADTNAPLAVAVIGGMLSSTLLTLVVVPSMYSLVENGFERIRLRHALSKKSEKNEKED